mgnify:CR=1 FL=1
MSKSMLQVYIHLVWRTKGARPILRGRLERFVHHRLREIADDSPDWDVILELASRHRLYSPLRRTLESIAVNPPQSIDETLDLGWDLLSMLPKEELNRIDEEYIEQYYDESDTSEQVADIES